MTGPGSRKASKDAKKLGSKGGSKTTKSAAGRGLNKHKQESHSDSKATKRSKKQTKETKKSKKQK